jgi:hypothetical protein
MMTISNKGGLFMYVYAGFAAIVAVVAGIIIAARA